MRHPPIRQRGPAASRHGPAWGRLSLAALLAAVLGMAALPMTAQAADVRSGSSITIGPDQTVNDDVYAFGSTVEIQGRVNGDVVAMGSTVIISGTVTRDVIAAGSVVTISGNILGTARVAGTTVDITGSVDGDLLAAGTQVTLSSQSSVGRDLLAAGTGVTMSGSINRDVRVGGTDVTLNGTVGRNFKASVQTLHLKPGASIAGNLDYISGTAATIDSGAVVTGAIHRTAQTVSQPSAVDVTIGWIRLLVGFFLLGLVLILLVPGFDRAARAAVTPKRRTF